MKSGRLSALIVEDDVAYSELLREMLIDCGRGNFEAEVAHSLGSALARLNERHFDLALLDLHLPDAQGPSACEAIRSAAPPLPIVIVSGSTEEEGSAGECLQKGAQDYLVKGEFDRRHLSHSVRYAIQRKKIEVEYNDSQSALIDANRELVEKVRELDRLNAIMMGREERILEMKDEIKALRDQLLKNLRLAS